MTCVLFGRCIWRLLMAVGNPSGQCPKQHTTLYMVGWCMSTFIAWKSALATIFSFPFLSLSSTSKGVLTLQNCKVIFNFLIVSNLIYLLFNFIIWYLIFYVFLSNLILILLISIYFSFNLFMIRFYFSI